MDDKRTTQLLAALEYSLDHSWEESVKHFHGRVPSALLDAVFRIPVEERHNLFGAVMSEEWAADQVQASRVPLEDTGPWQDNAIRQLEEQ